MKISAIKIGLETMLATALIFGGIKWISNKINEYPKMLPTQMICVGEESYPYTIESEKNYLKNKESIERYRRKVNYVSLIAIPEIICGFGLYINILEKTLLSELKGGLK